MPVAKEVLLWVASPFGFWGGDFNQTQLDEFLNATIKFKDVVDVMSPVSYAVEDPSKLANRTDGGLVLLPNADVIIKALQAQGFQVEPLVGTFYNQNHISWFRHYFTSSDFRQACVSTVKELGLDGLNFDFEVSDCDTDPKPCTPDDAHDYANMLSNVKGDLRGLGRLGADARVSVDTGQCTIAKTNWLNVSTADYFATMNTYASRSDFDIALPRDLGIEGPDRFSLGVCPGCFNSTEEDIAGRMEEATRLGVRKVAYWAGTADPESYWWSQIRKWKAAGSTEVLV